MKRQRNRRWISGLKARRRYSRSAPQELIDSQEQAMELFDSVIMSESERHLCECPVSSEHGLYDHHMYICAYKIMYPRDIPWQRAQCKKWCADHVRIPENSQLPIEPCDLCTKMTQIAFSADGDVMFASRTSPDDIAELTRRCTSFEIDLKKN